MTKPLLSILLLLPLSVSAEQCREQTLPAEKASPSQDNAAAQEDLILLTNGWPMVGETRLKVMFWELYDAQLFTPSGTWCGGPPYQLSLTYLRQGRTEQLVKRVADAWRRQGLDHPNRADWLAQLNSIWPDVSVGDNLVFILTATGRNGFWLNENFLGGVNDQDFGPMFGDIWLAPDTLGPNNRARLINQQATVLK
jgi:hypothetical protein